MPTGREIRAGFLDFFAARDHRVVRSAPIVPEGDPSLLFTNAGMVQFKQIFLGQAAPSHPRVADAQKCLRLSGKHNDLEQVGRDTYHHTLFEMLGNWSFGDYYKAEAIEWAWELLVKEWELPQAKLWATVHTTDDEAEQLWRRLTPLPAERVLRFERENFWEMGETGPCGPCSEIHLDRGPAACDRQGVAHACRVNGDCARYIELWNLVFIQYNREPDQSLRELPSKHVDTGMGLERVTAVLQNVLSNYDTDLFRGIIAATETLARRRYGADPEADVSFRVIADHARAVSVMIADHVLPANEGRGYVLRRVLRRAARHGKMLGLDGPFLTRLVGAVAEILGGAYPELRERQAFIAEVVATEESRFAETLDKGLGLLESEIVTLPATGGVLPGDVAFKLYDTYGFPLDLTEDIVRGRGHAVDDAGFRRAMEEQRARGREHKKFVAQSAASGDRRSRFVGDRIYAWESTVTAVATAAGEQPGGIRAGEVGELVTEETPFYGESGGQVGDVGKITSERGDELEVLDTVRHGPELVVHRVRVLAGGIAPGDRVRLTIDAARRERIRLNHSATHLMHGVLRERLGAHVRQAGSLVAPDRLRFDFSHTGTISPADLDAMEDEINARIRANVECVSEEMSYEDAMKRGALAFFGDKYGDRVRVLQMGAFSIELCGGTHVQRTGDIGLFKFRSEGGVAAGVRRIEAMTGGDALDWVQEREERLQRIGAALKASEEEAVERLERLLAQSRELERRIEKMQRDRAKARSGDLLARAVERNGMKVLAARVDDLDDKALRELADRLKEELGSGVVALGAAQDGKVSLVAAVSKDLTKRVHAGNLIKRIAPVVGGNGGGRADFAQAGGRDAGRLDEALAMVPELVA
ncbi:MAG: alanine--tRNA ligase [Polyangiaceae bacterium UTPRO1]|nr:alanine--tRNA ligase [Myxococcales bacterium]OQY65379.1 MAG: alanine--tRNA ligase [Polyangiaceae bacterium UTPRO1]